MSLQIYALGEMHIKTYRDSFRTSGVCSEILKQYFKEWNKWSSQYGMAKSWWLLKGLWGFILPFSPNLSNLQMFQFSFFGCKSYVLK